MGDPNDRHYLEYLGRMKGVQDVVREPEQPVTARFQTLPQQPSVQVMTVERPVCPSHSGVCVAMEGLKARIEGIEKELKDSRGSWRVLLATAGGGALVALLTWLLQRGG